MIVSVTALRQRPLDDRQLRLHALDDRDGVLAHRAPDVEHAPPACRRATPPRRPLERVLGVADVGHADRRAVLRRDDDVVELARWRRCGRACAAAARPCPARRCRRDLDVLGDDRVAHLRRSTARRSSASRCRRRCGSRARGRRRWSTSPTPLTVWIARVTCLSAISVSVRRLIASDETTTDITGSASGSTFVMTGGSSSGGTFLHRAADLLADVVGRVVDVALEHEPDA